MGSIGVTMFNTIVPPNGGGVVSWGGCFFNDWAHTANAHYVLASSQHPGGVNVLFGDGSVRFIKNSIAMATWWAIGTRANGEVVSSDAY